RLVYRAGIVGPFDEVAVRIERVDRADELMVGLRHMIAMVEPLLFARLQLLLAAMAGEGEMVDPPGQAEAGGDGALPLGRIDLHTLDAAQIPQRHRLAVANVVEHMLGPAAAARLALYARAEREAHD